MANNYGKSQTMSLSSITEEVTKRVEEKTGRPVLVQPDPSLQVMATIRTARGDSPAHVVLYNPSFKAYADYLICWQCGFTLRLFSIEEGSRFDVAGTYWGRRQTEKLLAEHLQGAGTARLSKEAREGFRDQIFEGLVRQLRSMPIGLRVDAWILREFPGLGEQQRAMIVRQINDNTAVLRPEIRRLAPPTVFNANVSMNAAFALFWSRAWDDPRITAAYRATGHADTGQALLGLYDSTPEDPAEDKRLIEAWGTHLGLTGWFEFLPYSLRR